MPFWIRITTRRRQSKRKGRFRLETSFLLLVRQISPKKRRISISAFSGESEPWMTL